MIISISRSHGVIPTQQLLHLELVTNADSLVPPRPADFQHVRAEPRELLVEDIQDLDGHTGLASWATSHGCQEAWTRGGWGTPLHAVGHLETISF